MQASYKCLVAGREGTQLQNAWFKHVAAWKLGEIDTVLHSLKKTSVHHVYQKQLWVVYNLLKTKPSEVVGVRKTQCKLWLM